MSPHGLPDWGLTGPKHVTYGLDDVGEAVARLGSPNVWDRRGDVILVDDFRYGLGSPAFNVAFAGGSYGLVTDPVMGGGYSVRLTTAAAAGSFVEAIWHIIPRVQSAYGFECWFTLAEFIGSYHFGLQYYDGVSAHLVDIRLNVTPLTLAYLSSGGVWVPLPPPPNMKPNDILFHVLKVVADMLTDEHVRLIIDGVTYPLLGIPVRVVPYVANREILVAAHVNGNGVFADDAYLDRVIVTQNEPT